MCRGGDKKKTYGKTHRHDKITRTIPAKGLSSTQSAHDDISGETKNSCYFSRSARPPTPQAMCEDDSRQAVEVFKLPRIKQRTWRAPKPATM